MPTLTSLGQPSSVRAAQQHALDPHEIVMVLWSIRIMSPSLVSGRHDPPLSRGKKFLQKFLDPGSDQLPKLITSKLSLSACKNKLCLTDKPAKVGRRIRCWFLVETESETIPPSLPLHGPSWILRAGALRSVDEFLPLVSHDVLFLLFPVHRSCGRSDRSLFHGKLQDKLRNQ